MYTFLVILHVVGAFGFMAFKSLSWATDLGLGSQRDPERLRDQLRRSKRHTQLAQAFFYPFVLFGGIVVGFVGNLWGQLWVGLSLLLLVAGSGVPAVMLRRHTRAIGAALEEGGGKKLETLLASSLPKRVATVEVPVLTVIIFLMEYKLRLG